MNMCPFPHDDDDTTVITSNCSHSKKQQQQCTNDSEDATVATAAPSDFDSDDNSETDTKDSIHLTLGADTAIADLGATAHFLLPHVNILNKRKATHPLNITLPDGDVIHSTHIGNLNLPGLNEAATEAHIVPGLAHSSLISIKQLCDNGCHVIFTKNDCKVYFKAELVLIGKRDPTTGL